MPDAGNDVTATVRDEPSDVGAPGAMRPPPVTDDEGIDRALDEVERVLAAGWDGDGSDPSRASRALRSLRGSIVANRELEADAGPTRALARLRAAGWTVGVHNDYRLGGVPHTFWLLTHPDGRYVRGEGLTDAEALRGVTEAVAAMGPATPPTP